MPRSPLHALAAITALAALVRFATLDVQSFWLDEGVTAHLVRPDLGGMLSAIPDSESTPPLYYLLAWVWSKLFGPWEVGLRSLSALIGTATVPVVYALAVRVASERAGLAAAALALDQRSNRFAEFIEGPSLVTRVLQIPKQLLVAFDAPLEPLAIVLALA